ncbi:MAG: hypothetical protein AB8B81_13295 [Halioglobus sp.]
MGDGLGYDGFENAKDVQTLEASLIRAFDASLSNDGIVILSTGKETLATEIAGEWVFWKTGNIDSLLFLMSLSTMLLWMAAGSILIMGLILTIIAVKRHQKLHI